MTIDKCHTLSQTGDVSVDDLVDQCEEQFEYSEEKNQWLLAERGFGFKKAITAIIHKKVFDVIDHPNRERYPHQRLYVVQIDDYMCAVPFVLKEDGTIFLKTIFRDRKLNKKYLLSNDKGA